MYLREGWSWPMGGSSVSSFANAPSSGAAKLSSCAVPAGIDAYARRVISRLAIDEARRPYRRAELRNALPDTPVDEPEADHIPLLVACVLTDDAVNATAGAIGVFPGDSGTCAALGLARVAPWTGG
jgi:hypothetical protein